MHTHTHTHPHIKRHTFKPECVHHAVIIYYLEFPTHPSCSVVHQDHLGGDLPIVLIWKRPTAGLVAWENMSQLI